MNLVTSLLKIIKLRKNRNRKLITENDSPPILEKILENFIILKKENRKMEVLLEVYKPKDQQAIQLSFKGAWRGMERVDKIESLVSIEKEIAGYRNELCQEMMDFSKGKW